MRRRKEETQGCLMELFCRLKLTPFYYPIFRVASHISLSLPYIIASKNEPHEIAGKNKEGRKDDKYQQHLKVSIYKKELEDLSISNFCRLQSIQKKRL